MNQSPNCFVATIDLNLADKLKQGLIEQGFSLTKPPYTLFSAKKKGISCTLFESGKLTVQGKDKGDFITYFLEPEILNTFTYGYTEINVDFTPRIGMDEAGKGDFFGPLCAAAIYASEEDIKMLVKNGVRDSKKMSDDKIALLAKTLQPLPHTVIRIFPKRYNALYKQFGNLNELLAWAHSKALEELLKKIPSCEKAIIDQFAHKKVMEAILRKKNIAIDLTQRHRGEEDPVVAAASILARYGFVEGIKQLGIEHNIDLPKGASHEVIRVGKKIFNERGLEVLEGVSKVHFKTYKEVTEPII